MERRIARRYIADSELEIWVSRKGALGRVRRVELPVADLSMFGASVFAEKGAKLAQGQVVEVSIGGASTTAIIRSERTEGAGDGEFRYGLEFVKPSDAFLGEVRLLTEAYRRSQGESVTGEELWLRTS